MRSLNRLATLADDASQVGREAEGLRHSFAFFFRTPRFVPRSSSAPTAKSRRSEAESGPPHAPPLTDSGRVPPAPTPFSPDGTDHTSGSPRPRYAEGEGPGERENQERRASRVAMRHVATCKRRDWNQFKSFRRPPQLHTASFDEDRN